MKKSYLLALLLASACAPLPEDASVETQDTQLEDTRYTHGSIGGYLRHVPEFNVESDEITLEENNWESHLDLFIQTPRENEELVWVMNRIRLMDGQNVFDLDPGTYTSSITDPSPLPLMGIGCYGYVREQWSFDSVADVTTVVISDGDDGYRTVEFEFSFGDDGYLSGYVALPVD